MKAVDTMRILMTGCVAAFVNYAAYAQDSKEPGKEPGPKDPKKLEAVMKGDKPEPKPVPKNELVLVESSGNAFLVDRAQLMGLSDPMCKIKCASVTLSGKKLIVSESALGNFKLSPPVANYFKESAQRFGPNTTKWPAPISPEAAQALGSAAMVVVAPQY